MRGFVSLTHHGTNRKFTVALSVIGTIEPEEFKGKTYTTLVLSFTKTVYMVSENYEEVLKRIEEAQAS